MTTTTSIILSIPHRRQPNELELSWRCTVSGNVTRLHGSVRVHDIAIESIEHAMISYSREGGNWLHEFDSDEQLEAVAYLNREIDNWSDEIRDAVADAWRNNGSKS